MKILFFSIFLAYLNNYAFAKEKELFLFTHTNSPSHLSVVFNFAEKVGVQK
jgi:hypothetical protein